MSTTAENISFQPVIAPLSERDLPEAERIFRVAFGTFLGAPDPETFWADRDYVYGRSRAPHVAAFGATLMATWSAPTLPRDGAASAFSDQSRFVRICSERGIAKALLAATVDQFDAWRTTQNGLFTFAQSAKHVALYQKFGFYPRFLTAIMFAPARKSETIQGRSRFSTLSDEGKAEALRASREVTDALYPGLDLSEEIVAVDAQGLGDTVLVAGTGGLAAFAICHYGPRSEAGEGFCFIKFGAVRATPSADKDYGRLLDAAEALAVSVAMPNLLAGANLARHEAYQHMVARGFRTAIQGVNMHGKMRQAIADRESMSSTTGDSWLETQI